MNTDKYTKTILTVIALALCTIVVQNFKFINNANANNSKILLDDMNVNIKSIGGSSVYGELPINLKAIGGSSFYGSVLPINIKEVNGSSVNSSVCPLIFTR